MYYLLALGSAVFESVKDTLSKRSLITCDAYVGSWALRFFSLPFILPFVIYFGIPQINASFFVALIFGGLLNVVSTILYMKAMKESDLSLVAPMVTFTPVFLLLTSPLMIGEFPSGAGLLGVLLIFFGSYMLHFNNRKNGFLGPVKSLFTQKGSRYMLLVAFLWSISANFDKVGIVNSNPFFWIFCCNLFIAICMVPVMFFYSSKPAGQIKSNFIILSLSGLASAVTLTFHMFALAGMMVAYVISIKRSSALFSVISGYIFFKERNLQNRLLGALIMVAGVIVIALF